MNILFISQHFPPEVGADSGRVSELTKIWAKEGKNVTVLTGYPISPAGNVHTKYKQSYKRFFYRELIDGVNVIRTWLLAIPNHTSIQRILSYMSFCLSSLIIGIFVSNPNVIIATSPQLLSGLSGFILSFIKRVPFILEIRDLWPESLVGAGVGTETTVVYKLLSNLSKFLYKHSVHIIVVTPAFKEFLVGNYEVNPSKISVIRNGVDLEVFNPNVDINGIREKLNLQNEFVVSYIGTIGLAHGLETILDAAEILKTDYPNIKFLIVGDGAQKEVIETKSKNQKLPNINFIPQQAKNKVPPIINISDVCLVLLKKADVFKTVIPTKMLEYMACGKPIILGVQGQALEIMQEANSGLSIEPENSESLAESIVKLLKDVQLRTHLGNNGLNYAKKYLSREDTADEYLNLINKIVIE